MKRYPAAVRRGGRRISTSGGFRSGRERKTSYAGRGAVGEGDAAPAAAAVASSTAPRRAAVRCLGKGERIMNAAMPPARIELAHAVHPQHATRRRGLA